MTEMLIIAWLWVVGVAPSYYAITRAGTRQFSMLFLISAHLWPIALPAFFVVGILGRRPS